jgi:aspartate dehydrogenase
VLEAGVDVTLISVGALADRKTEASIRACASRSGARAILPAGAVGGLDLLASARLDGLSRVRYIARKPPEAWAGTEAYARLKKDERAGVQTLYEGNAREAALQFPQNANVAAAIALAGLGFEATEVAITADSTATGNEHVVVAEGAFGRAEMRFAGRPLPSNPKTS